MSALRQLYFARAMLFVEKNMNGASPADRPIECPERFELAINMRIAAAIGLTVTTTLLAQVE
jgi:putative ABC transport system substrate-binding protein